MTDERLDSLGKYFVHFDIWNRFGIKFERFVYLVDNGLWREMVA